MRRLNLVWILMIGLVTMFGVGCAKRDLSKPPLIRYGQDTCSTCRMILEDNPFGGAAVSADETVMKFDDLGCLAAYMRTKIGQNLRSWVKDMDSGKWIEVNRAKYIYSSSLVTPMGSGFAAFTEESRAKEFAEKNNGRVIEWEELLNFKKE